MAIKFVHAGRVRRSGVPARHNQYRSRRDPRTALGQRIRELAQPRVRYGYHKITVLLNREGWRVGKKLVLPPVTGKRGRALPPVGPSA